ncbi:MAG: AMP-binding protein [Acidimicrobiia bacterium]|nr:AMP-binding protein [Acidimicrobiia bacterium]
MKELVYHRLLLPALSNYATKVGFVDGDYRGTFEQHGDRVLRLTDSLHKELGLSSGDRFALMATNSHQYLEAYHAAYLGAGVINPLNLRLAGKELAYIVQNSGCEVAFVDSFFAEHFHRAMEESEGENPVRHTVLIGDGDGPHDVNYEDLISAGEPIVPDEPEEDDPVVLMYTGGTTGLPKGVLLEHRAEMLNLYHIGSQLRFDPEAVFLHQTPMFHAASMGGILGSPASGGTSVFIPIFDPGGVLDLIESEQVTQTVMVPTMIGMLLNHDDFRPERLASLRELAYGASPMPRATLDKLQELYPDLELSQAYGMTEASAVLTWLGPDDHRRGGDLLGSAGRAMPGVVLSIQGADGAELPRGESGEVCAKAGNFMREYWRNEEATTDVFRDGWYHTGDAGYLDDEGYLFLVDRVKDMIVTGGENVYSAEVEAVIASDPGVDQVAVIGIPSEQWGEQVHAIIVPKSGATLTEDGIKALCKENIAGFKVPKSVEFRDEPLPLSGALKVLKKELRKPYWEGKERSVG